MGALKIYFVASLPNDPSDAVLDVHNDADYLTTIHSLEKDEAGKREELWIRNAYHFSWLKAYTEYTGLAKSLNVEFSQVTARDILSERWGLSLPDWLTNEAIAEENLLDALFPQGAMDVPTALLIAWLPSMTKLLTREFPASHAGHLAEKVSQPDVTGRLNSGLGLNAWKAFCERWKSTARSRWHGEFVDRLQKDSKRLWSDLTIWSILCGYPEKLKGFALDIEALAFLKQVPPESLDEMEHCPLGVERAVDQISHYLNQILNGSPDANSVDDVLRHMSGKLNQEFVLFERLLEAVPQAVTTKRIQTIESLFAATVVPERLVKLRSRIRPPEPQVIPDTAGPAEWLRWSVQEYLPYRIWQVQQQSFDPSLERMVVKFSRWYTNNYAALHGDADLSAIQGLSQWKDQIRGDDFSLILLIDNLPYFFIQAFDQAMRSAGFFLHDRKARFVPLPSKTDVSKPMLLAGKPTDLTDYSQMLKLRSLEEWQTRDTNYFSSLSDLKTACKQSYPRVALLNYLSADEFLHKDSSKSGVSEEEQLGLLFKVLAVETFDICHHISLSGKQVGVYVLTDHGATRLIDKERRAVDSTLSKKLFMNEKCRSATMSAKQAETIPDNLWSLGIRFECPLHSDKVHFIPLGHNTVASTRLEESYFHGGATPEEVIVPFSVYRLSKPERSRLGIRITDSADSNGVYKWYIKRVVTLTFDLQNRSRSACMVSQVKIIPEVGEIRHFDAVEVLPESSAICKVSLYFQQTATQIAELTLTLVAMYGNEPDQISITIPVAISSAMSGGLNLKTL